MSTKNMFPDSYDLLQMPEIWIGDTAATTDMTPHQMGMTEVASPQDNIHVVMGNKQVERSTTVGCISSVVCNNQGNQKIQYKNNGCHVGARLCIQLVQSVKTT